MTDDEVEEKFRRLVEPVYGKARAGEMLGVATGTPAISFEEIGFDQDNVPVVHATSYFRDDLLRYVKVLVQYPKFRPTYPDIALERINCRRRYGHPAASLSIR